MPIFALAKGSRLFSKPASCFFSPAFGVTGVGLAFSKPSPENSKPSVKNFTPSAVKSARRFVTPKPALKKNKPGSVKIIGTDFVYKG